jgi:hypothetical protein
MNLGIDRPWQTRAPARIVNAAVRPTEGQASCAGGVLCSEAYGGTGLLRGGSPLQ